MNKSSRRSVLVNNSTGLVHVRVDADGMEHIDKQYIRVLLFASGI